MVKLPLTWVNATLADVTSPYTSMDPTRFPNSKFSYIDIGSIDNQTQSIREPKTFLGRDAPSRARRVVQAGDILFSTVRTYLKNIAVVPEVLDGALTSTGIAVLRPNHAVEGRYLFHWVKSDFFISTMSKAQDGTLYPAVTDRDVAGGAISLPPLPEQKRIVAKVEKLIARTARASADLIRIPILVARYKQRLVEQAFSGELTENWRKTKGISGVKLASLASLCLTLTDGDHQAPPRADEGVPFITISAMNTGKIDLAKATRKVPQSYFDRLRESRRPSVGDVLFSVTGSIGISALVETNSPFVFQRHIAILKPDRKKTSGKYLSFLLSAPQVKAQVDAVATGTAQLTVPLGGLRGFSIPAPSLDEQNEIIRVIEATFRWLDRMAADSIAASKLLVKLDAAIFDRAFHGALVHQDPNDEPAIIQLERVRAQREVAPKLKRERKLKSKKEQIMPSNIKEVLTEAADWLPAQEAFRRCGITNGAETEAVELIFAELRALDKAGLLEVNPVADDNGRKLYDRLRLKAV